MVRTLKPLFFIADEDVSIGSTIMLPPSFEFARSIVDAHFATQLETTNLKVTPLTPTIEGDHHFYRERVTAQISISELFPYKSVVLAHILPNETQLLLQCHAECRSCSNETSPASSQHCRPVIFDLDPVPDLNSDQPLELKLQLDESNGVFIADVTFEIRTPKSEDEERRCRSESLMCVCIGIKQPILTVIWQINILST